MQECEGFINGTTNYSLLKGDTGPLVYPAGFVYVYTILYYITSKGQNIRLAQYIFAGVYLIQLYLVLRLYAKTRKVPPYVLILCTFTSYRIHSIYILRLFNDPIAVLFMYLALNFYMDQKWCLASIFFSVAVSIKMNILLFAPAIFLFYIVNLGWTKTIYQIFICGFVQLILGIPFLLTYPIEYIKGSFNLVRVFDHKWTVNYRFLDQNIFENRYFHISLLILHLCILLIISFPSYQYFKSYCRLRMLESQLQPQIDKQNKKVYTENFNENENKFSNKLHKSSISNTKSSDDLKNNKKYSVHFEKAVQLALLPIFLCNFVGIIFARSLHYQFYVWYFHSLPYLCWSTDYSHSIRFLLLGLIEFCWNTYPSTNISSALLHICHFLLFLGVVEKLFKSHTISKKIISSNNCKFTN